ncbi:MAG: RES domain-containing protein [Acidocella sp.]|nr:RES domain-containing protein [Acidocella sp.]
MTPLPPPLGSGEFIFWRLDEAKFAGSWDSGEGGYRVGGRWNSRGVRAVYAALDPATSILEVAVHKTFRALDIVPHIMTSARITDIAHVHVVTAADIPNANWLRPGAISVGQQAFGDELLKAHRFVLIPSVVSTHSWNVIFDSAAVKGLYAMATQEAFALDPRLHPAV